jgi:predicted nucleic-acid-binding protein
MMISVDTNVVVRLLTADDQQQFTQAKALFANESIIITTTVILECEWVLRYAYQFNQSEIATAFKSLFGLSNVRLQDPLVLEDAIEWFSQGMDFGDAIHLATSKNADAFVTFDKKLINTARKITNFPVREP